mmetsp:Transcript_32574/g.85430  ORF Transcript_32574/g.85430 Transcript_32574/m.85430 type:complete len:201 (-) Transcript_32574:29-631(-)
MTAVRPARLPTRRFLCSSHCSALPLLSQTTYLYSVSASSTRRSSEYHMGNRAADVWSGRPRSGRHRPSSSQLPTTRTWKPKRVPAQKTEKVEPAAAPSSGPSGATGGGLGAASTAKCHAGRSSKVPNVELHAVVCVVQLPLGSMSASFTAPPAAAAGSLGSCGPRPARALVSRLGSAPAGSSARGCIKAGLCLGRDSRRL